MIQVWSRIVPPVKHVALKADAQVRMPRDVAVVGDCPEAEPAVRLVTEELRALGFITDSVGAADITLSIGEVEGTSSHEAYRIDVDEHVLITGASAAGLHQGTRSLLQALTWTHNLPAGTLVDEPDVAIRSLHLDAARKYFTVDWLETLIRQMSWLKLNQLQYHFSENEGFRLASKSHPEVVSNRHITLRELRHLVTLAARHHIEVVPALDLPGHMRHILDRHPHLRASQSEEGRMIVDYSRSGGRELVLELIAEYAGVFESDSWHLGGDEVFSLGGDPDNSFPSLLAYAREHVGPHAGVVDGYMHFLSQVTQNLWRLGKTRVRAWSDALYREGSSTALPPQVEVTYWSRSHTSFPSLEKILSGQHGVINFNDRYLYYVITKPGLDYHTKPSAKDIYTGWNPGIFPDADQRGTPQSMALADPQLLGASFAIWCDHPHEETEDEIAEGMRMPLRAMASRSWHPRCEADYATWRASASALPDPPGAQPAHTPKQTVGPPREHQP